jgi:hypothetical protein
MLRSDVLTVLLRVMVGNIRMLPLLAIPFGVWTAETWLRLQIYGNDYEFSAIRSEMSRTQAQIEQLEERAVRLKTLRQLEAQAPNMGLIEPAHDQIRLIEVTPTILAQYTNQGPNTPGDARDQPKLAQGDPMTADPGVVAPKFTQP